MVTSLTLHEAFIPFGPLVDVTLPKPELPSNPDPHRGFGYIEFELAEDAREALDNMDQSELFGRVIRVNVAKEKKAEGEKLGSKTAVWEQVSQSQLFYEDPCAHYSTGRIFGKVCCERGGPGSGRGRSAGGRWANGSHARTGATRCRGTTIGIRL